MYKSSMQAHVWKYIGALFAFVLAWLVAGPAVALAHAQLASSNPAAGSLLDSPPQQIELHFTESVSLDFSTVNLYDRARQEHSLGSPAHAGNDENSLAVAVRENLSPGTYTVVWRVVSATDGHLTESSFAFRVRGSSATPGAGTGQTGTDEGPITPIDVANGSSTVLSETPTADPFRWAVRALMLACAALLLGGSLFTVLIAEPATTESGAAGRGLWNAAGGRFAFVGVLAACLLALCLVLDLLLEVSAIASTDLLSLLSNSDLAARLISSTSYGHAWILKLLAAVGLLVIMELMWVLPGLRSGAGGRTRAARTAGIASKPGASSPSTGLWEMAIGAGSLLFLGEALGSHAAAGQSGGLFGLPVPVASDWLHLVVASAWAGGLGYMLLTVFPAMRIVGMSGEERRAFLGRSIPRFSRLAIASVALLAITGTYNLLQHSSDLGTILGSTYGQVLALKLLSFAVLIGLGAVNLLRLTPRLTRKAGEANEATGKTDAEPVLSLRHNVRLEVGLALVALACAGGLTLLPPPGQTSAVASSAGSPQPTGTAQAAIPPAVTPQPTPGPATVKTVQGGYAFTLTARPAIEGDQLTLTMTRAIQSAAPLTDVSKVYFKVTPQDVNAGSTRYDASRADGTGPGTDMQVWSATDQILTLDGAYQVDVVIQRTVERDIKIAFRLDLSEDTGLKASPAQVIDLRLDSLPSPPVSGTVILTVTLLDGLGVPIPDAVVSVLPLMPAHAHVQPQGDATPVTGKPGVFRVPVKLQMGGSWLFICTVTRPNAVPVKIDSSLDVIDPNATPAPTGPP